MVRDFSIGNWDQLVISLLPSCMSEKCKHLFLMSHLPGPLIFYAQAPVKLF